MGEGQRELSESVQSPNSRYFPLSLNHIPAAELHEIPWYL